MPHTSSATDGFDCPQCGAQLQAAASRCWLCHAIVEPRLARQVSSAAPKARPQLPVSEHGYSLASLLMLMTLVAVLLGMFTVAPGLGILATIALVPAAVRTAWEIQRRKKQGQATSAEEKAIVFAASVGMVIVAGTAAAIAFSATCWGGLFAGGAFAGPEQYDRLLIGVVIGGAIGAILALCVFYRVMKALAPTVGNKPSLWLFLLAMGCVITAALVTWFVTDWLL